MEYKKQTLKAWWLTWQFETIKNFKIVKPAWKKSFWEDFFLEPADSLTATNATRTNVFDVIDINWVETVLSNDSTTDLNVSVAWTIIYTWVKWVSERMLTLRWGYDKRISTTITEVLESDPSKDVNDVFGFWYIRLKFAAMPTVWEYITFTSNTINLQWITTKVHYVQSGYAYVRWTNLYWTLPIVGESVDVNTKIGDVLVIAEKQKVVAINESWSAITLYEADADDAIIDIEKFNSTLFILTNKTVFFWRNLVNCNMNVYPLDFFDNMNWGTRLLKFWKMLLLFWTDNQIISPVNGTAWSIGYVTVDLNYGHDLFSKYSALSSQGSLYILQDDKQFVKVNIINTSNSEYDVVTEDVMISVQWMLDNIEWDVHITKNDKYISIVDDHWDDTSISYNYNILYKHWTTWDYDLAIKSLWDKPFWSTQFTYSEDVIEQELSFHLWGDSLEQMKTCYFVKMTLVAEQLKVPDYTFTIDKYIWGMKLRRTVELKDFPINNLITSQDNVLWYEQFWEAELSTETLPDNLWYIINVTVRINETADLFVFSLSNKDNAITYWWGIIWYKSMLPEVTPYNYTIKQTTR